MRRLILSLAVLAFFVNPGIACTSPDDGAFQFGEPEMRAAVEGQWRIDWSVAGGAATSVTVQVSQAGAQGDSGTAALSPAAGRGGFIRAVAACDSRSFVKSASACMDSTQMPLQVAYVSGDSAYQAIPLGGTFSVYGLSFSTGHLQLVFHKTSVTLGVRPDGSVATANGMTPEGTMTVTATRVSRGSLE